MWQLVAKYVIAVGLVVVVNVVVIHYAREWLDIARGAWPWDKIFKFAITAGLVVLVNEVVIRYSKEWLGSLIASLPLVSLITFFWIYYDSRIADTAARISKLANHSTGVFWFVLPSLPMFLLFPFLLKKGITFWPAVIACCALTMALYYGMVLALKKFGVEF